MKFYQMNTCMLCGKALESGSLCETCLKRAEQRKEALKARCCTALDCLRCSIDNKLSQLRDYIKTR